MKQDFLKFVLSSRCHRSKAAVNAPQSKRFATFRAAHLTRSVWSAVASAPLLARANLKRLPACLSISLLCISGYSAETNSVFDADAAYTRTINQRADKIVATLGITDTNKTVRVRDIIAGQYRDLNKIHEARDAQIKALKEKSGDDKAATNATIEVVQGEARRKLDQLHPAFLKRLSGELASEEVDKVKDGLTYRVLPLTYGVYLKMYPGLTESQKLQIKMFLTEARELAMDGSTSDEKHAAFGKYKGKINNYLSKAGYDAKTAEQNLKRAAQPTSDSKIK